MKEIKVTNCKECPFCNKDNEYGRDGCNHPFGDDIVTNNYDEMPKDKVHENCPLKTEPITVSL